MSKSVKKIIIKETKKCDTRTLKPNEIISKDAVEKDTKLHIEAVKQCGYFLCDRIKAQFIEHDYTKLGNNLQSFTKALLSGFKGKEFKEKERDWWEIHLTERHHLNDKVPEDVNLIDVLEMICDCVSAGMARTGHVFPLTLSAETLEKAFLNTVDLIKSNIVVERVEQKELV